MDFFFGLLFRFFLRSKRKKDKGSPSLILHTTISRDYPAAITCNRCRDMAKMEKEVKREVDADLQRAEAAPLTDPKELITDIFTGEQFPVRSCQGTVFI